jgi:hypothetical protein
VARTATRYLIVGWARGGLGYITQQLHMAGYDVGNTFDHTTTVENLAERLAQAKPYEVSSFLVPFLDHPALQGIPVLFVLRDPMRILNSLYFHGMFHTEKLSQVRQMAITHLPEPMHELQGRPAQLAIAYLIGWLQRAQILRPNLPLFRIELGPAMLFAQLPDKPVTDQNLCPADVNSSYCRQMIVPGQLPQPAQDKILKLLIQLGYRESAWMPRGGHAHYVNPDWHC